MIRSIEDKKERLETALYNWLDEVENLEQHIINLIDSNNNISKIQIAKDMDKMKSKLATLQNNIRKF